MSKPIIEIENISKLYHLGQLRSSTLRESLGIWWYRLLGKRIPSRFQQEARLLFSPAQRGPIPNTFWALKDVSFSVNRGEIVGVIGRNGAGKSTLLKILSRITVPTKGKAILRGRTASLLEVGTGFHPELSGRENIYVNGSILGMRRREIHKKSEEIIAFAELEKFINEPVKHYSTGMYLRLGFAIAAHLDPEILILDEVLAVGDVRFQKKCVEKMTEVSRQGNTILIVTHNVLNVSKLCKKTIFLSEGKMIFSGNTDEAIARYAKEDEELSASRSSAG